MFPWTCAHAVRSNLPKLKLATLFCSCEKWERFYGFTLSALSFTKLVAEAEGTLKIIYYLLLPLFHRVHTVIFSAGGASIFVIYESV